MDENDINVPATTNHIVHVVPISVPTHVSHGEKPEKFNGNDFKRWQQKMLFYLTTLILAKFLYEDAPVYSENEADRQAVAAVDAWKHSDFLSKTISSMDWITHYIMCIVQSRRLESCENPWIENTRRRMSE